MRTVLTRRLLRRFSRTTASARVMARSDNSFRRKVIGSIAG